MKDGTSMNVYRQTIAFAALAACLFSQFTFAADPPIASKPEQAIRSAAEDGKLIYLVFYKDLDAATKSMVDAVRASSLKLDDTSFTTVRISDPIERAVAEKFEVTRAPMPMVIAVHPNGAVTGHFQTKVTEANLSQCVVSPKKAECMKSLQQNQLVLVCLQAQAKQALPQGVRELQTDPHFANRTQVVTLSLSDPAEISFLKSMEVDPIKDSPMTVFLAPPGAMVGKFAITATKTDLAAKLAEAGKCCDDKNCKHNAQPAKQTQQSGRKVR
jgi:hypothetical protein